MTEYQPPRKTNVALNFSKKNTGTTSLSFGENEVKKADLNSVINTSFISSLITHIDTFNKLDSAIRTEFLADIQAQTGKLALVNSCLSTAFIAQIEAVKISQFCSLNSVVNTGLTSNISARFDINFNAGVFNEFDSRFAVSSVALLNKALVFSKPIYRTSDTAFYYDKSLELSISKSIVFDRTCSLVRSVRSEFNKTFNLLNTLNGYWEETKNLKIQRGVIYEQAVSLKTIVDSQWLELVRKRKNITFSHEVALSLSSLFGFKWDDGLELITKTSLRWDVASSIYYRKSKIEPWLKPDAQKPKTKKIDLNFCCKHPKVVRTKVLLNFDVDYCKLKPKLPSLKNQNWWYIVNNVSVVNTRTSEKINVYNGRYGTDRSRWCWSYSLVVAEPEMSKLQVGDIIRITVNGSVHLMLYEDYSKSRQFADIKYTLIGRSQSALLESKYSAVRSYLQENERTSVQLVQAELDRVNSGTQQDWQLIDDLGWIVETESQSYTNLAPIDAIKLVAEAGGGFIYSEKNSNTISIRPLYKKTYWDVMQSQDYDKLLPESLVLQHSESFEDLLNFNAITLSNPRNGNVGIVKRSDTAGDTLLDPVSNNLFNAASMGGYGKAKLAKAGRVEDHDFETPITQEFGECSPGEILAFNGLWWGVVDGVDVDFTYSKVIQRIKVERTVNE